MQNKLLIIITILLFINFLHAQNVIEEPTLEDEKFIIESTANPTDSSVVNYREENVFVKAPNFYAQKSTGEWVSLNAFEGKVIILNFMATYDRYCIKSLSPLQKLQKKYLKKGLQVLVVSVDDPTEVKKFLSKSPVNNFPFLLGSKELAKEYNVWGLPTIYILDKTLGIRKVYSGFINKNNLEKEIRKLL